MERDECYRLLGVPEHAPDAELRSAYRRAVRQWHPDRQPEEFKPYAEQRMAKINAAYAMICTARAAEPQIIYQTNSYRTTSGGYSGRSGGGGGLGAAIRGFIRDAFNF